MYNSSIAPRKGSKIQNRLGTNTTETTKTENILTKEYLDKYINTVDPIKGNAFNILFSSDDPNKYDVISYLLSQKVDQSKAIEFAIQKENYKQADDLIKNLNFNIISAIQNKSLTLVKYFVEEKGSDTNTTYFGSNLLSLAANLEEPYKTDITCYLLIKGATYLNTTLEEAEQDGQNANDFHKQIFFKAINENKLEVIKKFVKTYGFDVNTEYRFNTPLSTAINLKNSKDVVKYLLSKNANLDAALEVAIIYGNLQGVKTLLNAGAKINGNEYASPLILASEHGHAAIVKYLLKRGADYNVKGWGKDNLHSDVSFQLTQITEISTLCKKVNNTDFQKILDKISLTSISSNYGGYKNLSLEQIKQKFSKFKKQLHTDVQKFTEIKNLLEDYSSGRKIPINTNVVVDDEGYVSDFKIESEEEKPKTGSRLEHTPSKSGIFRTFSLEGLSELNEDQAYLGGDTKDIFDSEF